MCWNLATDAPVTTVAEALGIVTGIRVSLDGGGLSAGLKTGCAIESRQFQSRHAIENFLSLASAQVWQMLWLRHQARTKTPGPAAAILSDGQREALRALCATLPTQADAKQTLIALAKLGGYFGRKSDRAARLANALEGISVTDHLRGGLRGRAESVPIDLA
ncbi:MAG: hypothetical protein IPF99_42950 [Deltaproteobacteria bacterium]|nr:hypothetical protein [Deltaproteobacteria bacterium]